MYFGQLVAQLTTDGRTDKRSRRLAEPAYVNKDIEIPHVMDGSRGTLQRHTNLIGTRVPKSDTTWCSRDLCMPGSHEKILTNTPNNDAMAIHFPDLGAILPHTKK